jgi:hypothetical protein
MKALKIEGRCITDTDIENTLDAFQSAVDGYIESVTLVPGKAVMIVNEEGLLRNLPPNPAASMISNTKIVGTAIIVGVDGEEFTDVPEDVVKCINALFT